MKKINYFFILTTVVAIIVFACTKEEKNDPPTISFKTGTHVSTGMKYISSDTTLFVNDAFLVGITASTNSDKDLSSFQIVRKFEISPEVTEDTIFGSATFNFDDFLEANAQDGHEDFTFIISDKSGNTSQLSFTLGTDPLPPQYNEYDVVLGSFGSDTLNQVFASTTGETFRIEDAAANADKIDWLYFDDETFGHTIISPSDSNNILPQVFDDSYLQNWTKKNITTFSRTNLTVAKYDEITNVIKLIEAVYDADPTDSYISELVPDPEDGFSVNDIFAFRTEQTKKGLIKITEVYHDTTYAESYIKFSVKVEL
ncbi:MAG: hypothetical protein K8R68_05585 [Bacteroidales bacterium]|nr:hypothetical protein [Bacteroidales bacterium]